jgi:hypothetical protein
MKVFPFSTDHFLAFLDKHSQQIHLGKYISGKNRLDYDISGNRHDPFQVTAIEAIINFPLARFLNII